MKVLEAALQGVLQAATEFLPVSSSGHLRLMRETLGFESSHDLLFDLSLHLGTLVAVFVVYRRSIWALLRGLLLPGVTSEERRSSWRLLGLLFIASLPTAVIGLFLARWVGSDTFGLQLVGGLLVLNGAVLWASRYFGGDEAEDPISASGGDALDARDAKLTVGQALLVGCAQGFAVLPGISRAGSTIVAALSLGVRRSSAAEFSFLLSIPAILGAFVVELATSEGSVGQGDTLAVYLWGATIAALVGMIALRILLRMLERANMHHFAWYCWAIGLLAIIYGAM